MRKPAKIAALLILMISISAGATAQTSASATPKSASPAAAEKPELTLDQERAILLGDLAATEKVLAETRLERDAAVKALEAERAERGSVERSYAEAERQIATLNRSIEHYEKAAALYEKTIAAVEKQRDEAKHEAKRSRKIAIGLGVFTIGREVLRVLF